MKVRPQLGPTDQRFLRTKRRPAVPDGAQTVRMVDLFSGCGGLSLGVQEACRSLELGFEAVLAVESNAAIWKIYEANFSPSVWRAHSRVEDWFDAPIGRVLSSAERSTRRRLGRADILVGGPPCQGHSPLNNHTRGRDPKNRLYLRMVRAAEVLHPGRIFIENVPAIERDAGRVVDKAVRRLQQLGYYVDCAVVSLHDIGVPQLRRRHILLASTVSKVSVADVVASARIDRPRTLRWAINDLVARAGVAGGLLDTASVLSAENLKRARWLLEKDEYDLPNRLRPRCHRNLSHKYKSMYGRMYWDEPAQTITTGFGSPGQGRYLHPSCPRTITPHEAARIQFFPDWFSFGEAPFRSALSDAIGNAVPVKLGFVAAAAMLASLKNTAQTEALATAAE